MATLQNLNPSSLVAQKFFSAAPDKNTELLRTFSGILDQGRAQNKQAAQDQLFQQGAQSAFKGTQTADEAARLFASDPARAKALTDSAGVFTAAGGKRLAKAAYGIMNIQNPAQRNSALAAISEKMQAAGDDPSVFSSLIGLDSNQQSQRLSALSYSGMSVKDQVGMGQDERKTTAQERNVNSQIASRNKRARLEELKYNQAIINAQTAAAEGVTLDAKGRQSVNKDITGFTKGTMSIYDAAKSLSSLQASSSPASKLAAVFKFMKALDPTSAVKEDEQGQVYAATGAASALAGQLNSLLGQGKLSNAGFSDLVNTSNIMANSALQSTTNQVTGYLDTFGNTLPQKFTESLYGRIPNQLPVKVDNRQAAPNNQGTATVTPVTVGRFKVQEVN